MLMSRSEFLAQPRKAVTLLGMSGVGKTWLANKLPKTDWFHYSGDYRIGTKYLSEAILDNVKRQVLNVYLGMKRVCDRMFSLRYVFVCDVMCV